MTVGHEVIPKNKFNFKEEKGERGQPNQRSIPTKYNKTPAPRRKSPTREKLERLEDKVKFDETKFVTYTDL